MTQPNHPSQSFQDLKEHLNKFEKNRKHNRAMDLIAELEQLLKELVSRNEKDEATEELPQPEPTTEIPAPPAPEGAVPVTDPVETPTPVQTVSDPQQPPGSQPA